LIGKMPEVNAEEDLHAKVQGAGQTDQDGIIGDRCGNEPRNEEEGPVDHIHH
jgi:hypothetical protein